MNHEVYKLRAYNVHLSSVIHVLTTSKLTLSNINRSIKTNMRLILFSILLALATIAVYNANCQTRKQVSVKDTLSLFCIVTLFSGSYNVGKGPNLVRDG